MYCRFTSQNQVVIHKGWKLEFKGGGKGVEGVLLHLLQDIENEKALLGSKFKV